MKKLSTVIAVLAITLFSCTKQASKELAPQKMNGVEFAKKFRFELPYLDYSNDASVARGKKAKAEAVTFAVSFDLVLTTTATGLNTSISPDAEWGGVQKWATIDSTNNAVSVCNWNWSYSQAPPDKDCPSTSAGIYRSWTSDKVTYDVHLSPFVTKE